MTTIHPMSAPCTKSELDLFTVPNTQVAITGYANQTSNPNSSITNDANKIECLLEPLKDMNDLHNLYIAVEFRIRKLSGNNVVDLTAAVPAQGSTAAVRGDEVMPSQYFLNTMFNAVEMYWSNNRITPQNNMYHYKAYFEALFFTSRDAKETIMRGALWGTDSQRIEAVKESKWVQLYGRLHLDISHNPKLLIPMVPIRMVFYVNPDNVILKAVNPTTLKPKLEIREIKPHWRKYIVDPEVRQGIEDALQQAPAKYFITRAEPIHLTIPSNVIKYTLDNAIKSILPRLFVVGIIPNKDYAGNFETDAFTFAHNNLNYIAAYKGGQMVNSLPYKPDYENNHYIREYVEFYRSLSQDNGEIMNIKFDEFKNKCCFYAFNLSPDFTNSGAEDGIVNPLQSDAIQLEFGFKENTTQTYSVVVFPLYDNVISITANREAFTDY